jgi:creatinine amidohydrolase
MAMPPRRLSQLRAPQITELITARSVLVQPVGSIEQHGAHLPFETDLLVAATAAETVVEERGDERGWVFMAGSRRPR